MLKEFKDFINRGSVVDLAVGVIIGASFGKIVDAVVNNVVMPPIGLLLGGVDFSKQEIVLKADNIATADVSEKVAIGYGVLINSLIQFLIIAWVLFMIVKGVNSLKKAEAAAPAAPPAPSRQEVLLEEIRDALAKR